MSSHRREVRPRYGRIVALATSVTVSAVAALAGLGVLATAQAGSSAEPTSYHHQKQTTPSDDTSPASTAADQEATSQQPGSGTPSSGYVVRPEGTSNSAESGRAAALPSASGHGRRIVFSQSQQRVWLVGDSGATVDRTYLVSGSVYDNLQPGTYSVYSKSRWAVGVDDSGVMQYFVRFTQGPTGAAIGFHSIPTSHGVPLQTKVELGTPKSHGCIRQNLPDAIALWDFAPVGTKVVVTA